MKLFLLPILIINFSIPFYCPQDKSYPMSDHDYAGKHAPNFTSEEAPSVEVKQVLTLPTMASRDILLDARDKLLLFLPNYSSPAVTCNSGVSVILLSRQSPLSLQRTLFFNMSGEVTLSVHGKTVSVEPFLVEAMPPVPLCDLESVNYFVDRAVHIVNRVRLRKFVLVLT